MTAPIGPMPGGGALAREILPVIARYEDCWNRLDLEGLRQLWDRSETVFYVAEEVFEPLTGWPELEAYWERAMGSLERFSLRTWDHRFASIAPGVAAALFKMHWNAVMKGFDVQGFAAIGGDQRVLALLRQVDRSWRFFHYVESPLAPLPFLRSVYQQAVDGGF